MIGRVVAWATIIGGLSYLYLITARRIVVSTDAVETELTKKIVRIPYANLDHVTVRVMPLGGMLGVKFVTKEPRSVTRTQIPLIYDEVLRSAPQLVAALIAHGVDVRVRGRRVAAS